MTNSHSDVPPLFDAREVELKLYDEYNLARNDENMMIIRQTKGHFNFNMDARCYEIKRKDEFIERIKEAVQFLDVLRSTINPLARSEKFKETTSHFADWVIVEKRTGSSVEGWNWSLYHKKKFGEKKIYRWKDLVSGDELPVEERRRYSSAAHLFLPERRDFIWDLIENQELAMSWMDFRDESGAIEYITHEYLRKPWLQCAWIDKTLIQVYIFSSICRRCKEVSQLIAPSGRISILKDPETFTARKKAQGRLDSFFSKIELGIAATVSIACAYSYEWWVGITLFFALDSFFRVIRNIDRRNRRAIYADELKQLDEASGILSLAGSRRKFTPALFRTRLLECERSGEMKFPSEIYLILDYAEKRQGLNWAIAGAGPYKPDWISKAHDFNWKSS